MPMLIANIMVQGVAATAREPEIPGVRRQSQRARSNTLQLHV